MTHREAFRAHAAANGGSVSENGSITRWTVEHGRVKMVFSTRPEFFAADNLELRLGGGNVYGAVVQHDKLHLYTRDKCIEIMQAAADSDDATQSTVLTLSDPVAAQHYLDVHKQRIDDLIKL